MSIDTLLAEIRQSTAQYASTGAHCCLEMLDVCGIALQDSGAAKLFQEMTQLRVAVRRLMVAGNGLGDQAMTALSAYLWHSPEPLWELGLADNFITDKGLEELLRCLYNHPSHPPRFPDAQGGNTGSAFALRVDMKNNLIHDHPSLIKRVESAGGSGAVQLYVTENDGPPPQPAESGRPLPYLWVFRVWRSRTRTKTRRTRKTKKTKRKRSTGRAPASERVAVLPDAVRATVGGDVAKAALAAAAVAADAGRPAAAAAAVDAAAAAAGAGVAAVAAAAAGAAVVGGGAGVRDVEGVRPPVVPGPERKRTARMKLREG